MILYYDKNGFHKYEKDALSDHYVTDSDYRQSLLDELNAKSSGSTQGSWAIRPDENGKPILIELEIDKARELRWKRKWVFSIVNRGPSWYNTLTEAQKQELQQWYEAWLDAPNTLIEPSDPTWI